MEDARPPNVNRVKKDCGWPVGSAAVGGVRLVGCMLVTECLGRRSWILLGTVPFSPHLTAPIGLTMI
jgi:hypothetical protein